MTRKSLGEDTDVRIDKANYDLTGYVVRREIEQVQSQAIIFHVPKSLFEEKLT